MHNIRAKTIELMKIHRFGTPIFSTAELIYTAIKMNEKSRCQLRQVTFFFRNKLGISISNGTQ